MNKEEDPLKILFFGIGSIGKRHATILNNHYNVELYAMRTNKGQESHNLPITEFTTLEDAFSINPDICFITNPTFLHVPTIIECVRHNIPMFIEKPISNSLNGVDKLREEIIKREIFTYVAYNLRFHPIINHIKQIISSDEEKPIYFRIICSSYLPNWRPNQHYEDSYSAKREQGGGVILDLSHELDYINWLFGDIQHITGYVGKISNLKITSEDIGEIQIICKGGIRGSLHLDYLSHFHEHKIQIYYNTKYIEGNILNNTITTIDKNREIDIETFSGDRNDVFKKQLDFFFEQYQLNNLNLMNNFSEASEIFKRIIEFKSGVI